jgi:hypothetical protein
LGDADLNFAPAEYGGAAGEGRWEIDAMSDFFHISDIVARGTVVGFESGPVLDKEIPGEYLRTALVEVDHLYEGSDGRTVVPVVGGDLVIDRDGGLSGENVYGSRWLRLGDSIFFAGVADSSRPSTISGLTYTIVDKYGLLHLDSNPEDVDSRPAPEYVQEAKEAAVSGFSDFDSLMEDAATEARSGATAPPEDSWTPVPGLRDFVGEPWVVATLTEPADHQVQLVAAYTKAGFCYGVFDERVVVEPSELPSCVILDDLKEQLAANGGQVASLAGETGEYLVAISDRPGALVAGTDTGKEFVFDEAGRVDGRESTDRSFGVFLGYVGSDGIQLTELELRE